MYKLVYKDDNNLDIRKKEQGVFHFNIWSNNFTKEMINYYDRCNKEWVLGKSLISLADYKNKHGFIELKKEDIDTLIVGCKALKILYINKKNRNRWIYYYHQIMNELEIEIIEPTQDEIKAFSKGPGFFADFVLKQDVYNNDFSSLIKLYNTDKLEFYAACIKSQKYNVGFEYQLSSHILTLRFQTNDYDNTYKKYMAGLSNLKIFHKEVNKKIKKIKIDNYGVKKEAQLIHYVFDENFNLTHGVFDSRFDKSYSNSGGSPASYGHHGKLGKEISFYYNNYCLPSKRTDSASIFHEFGHFVNETIINKRQSLTKESFKKFLIKDYKLAFRNIETLKYHRYRKYYKHVSPPLDIMAKKNRKICDDTYSNELFAEIVCDIILSEKKRRKPLRIDNKAKFLYKMFPNTNYIVGQILKGKGVNKYKSFKK